MTIANSLKLVILFSVLISPFLLNFGALAQDSPNCLDCHEGYDKSLAGTSHRIDNESSLSSSIRVECISCHDNWKEHQEMPTSENITRPFKLDIAGQARLCGSCHLTPHQKAMASTDPHAGAGLICGSCHTIHLGKSKSFADKIDDKCLTCHKTVAFEFGRRSAHPISSANVQCIDCHELGGIESQLLKHGFDWTCQGCHPDKSGPFLYEHPINYSYLTQGGSCLECHAPHGSDNDKLLNQPGSGNCLQCHSIPVGHRTVHSGLGSKFACVDCHAQIHGSSDNRLFLDPQLGTRFFPDCYQSGCHVVNR